MPEGVERALPGTYVHASIANSLLLTDLSQIHDLQQYNIRARERRNAARSAKGKGAGKGKDPPRGKGPDDGPVVRRYLGDDSECTICLEKLYRSELVYRLTCNHVFHETCWDEYMTSTEEDPECPNCRGPGAVKSLYKYMGVSREEAEDQRRRLDTLRRAQYPAASASNSRGRILSRRPPGGNTIGLSSRNQGMGRQLVVLGTG